MTYIIFRYSFIVSPTSLPLQIWRAYNTSVYYIWLKYINRNDNKASIKLLHNKVSHKYTIYKDTIAKKMVCLSDCSLREHFYKGKKKVMNSKTTIIRSWSTKSKGTRERARIHGCIWRFEVCLETKAVGWSATSKATTLYCEEAASVTLLCLVNV